MADLALVSMTAQGRSVGLLVSLPVDFSSASGKVDQSVFEGRGLAGSMVIDGHTTLIIDPDSLFRAARPEWYAEDLAPSMGMAAAPKKGASGALVLLAEDSGFFRAKISALLESSGYRVLGAEDGSRALDLFQDNPGIVAVVSDLEMPVMGGADLARRLRSKGTRIPIIALTSLASEEDKRLALEAGVTEFMIKLDEEELVSCLARLIRSGQSLS